MAKIISNHGAFPTCDAGATAVAADLGSPSSAPRSAEIEQFESTGLAKLSGLWETGGMKKPELTDLGWLGPKDEMDRASHRRVFLVYCSKPVIIARVLCFIYSDTLT
jgi:hypothetical protein